MQPLPLNLDLDALRSYVLGLDCGSFALAAQRLCRSTSAVSAQLKKLEQQCGTELVMKRGRHLVPTASGERLLGYAKRLLELNDEAVLALKGELLQGEIRLGVQEDFGESLLPAVLGPLCRQHPTLRMTTRIDRNAQLMKGIREGTLDMALAWQHPEERIDAHLIDLVSLQWIAHSNWDPAPLLARGEPLPLVLFDAPCLMRSRALKALDDAGIPWRIAFTSQSLGGIWAALQAGLGITVRSAIDMPTSLSPLAYVLPSPGTLGVVLLGAGNGSGEAERQLQSLLTQAVQRAHATHQS
ncbi:TPA: LysR family transcriptional regulator [Aeromonas salmonicida]|uniref:Transcriptional regulator, LysR family n=2 Tax=Aeromonas salmonicida subsp. salmonicida TaxID=29491 RepID=A4SIM7_AERS4|nr:LysR substrate-binding domain-containing protein [Aeromonas salmonicida]ABO88749.1 transcriptional regulator, LysR family [Aeromonas salmonicida subsp. salmonicida A449]ASI22099.1 LysR family transcriptional regulator [Aeromonas salmonicida]ASI26414.1 LysR family transcriptional regulator [Aeromonas salmonicida]ASI30533.1 LysR family transcriptional regulator [Aeromonas salmonicida]ATD37779.1 LysR family transcriptional regulator [Aeromonas salmonicida subsp. masoucida]